MEYYSAEYVQGWVQQVQDLCQERERLLAEIAELRATVQRQDEEIEALRRG